MDQNTRAHFTHLHSTDAESRAVSFMHLLKLTQQPVDWAYEVWDELLTLLREGDNYQRALALLETEEDPKYRKKYSGLWRDRRRALQDSGMVPPGSLHPIAQ